MIVGYASDKSLCGKFLEPVYREYDIPVLLKTDTIKVGGDMTHYQFSCLDVPGDHPVVTGHSFEGPVASSVKPSG